MAVATGFLGRLLSEQKEAIDPFFQKLDLQQMEGVLADCLQCKGTIILTGVGKSGIIAEKVAMTLLSTGTRALYLPAYNLLHGEGDVALLLSKSGETAELLGLVPYLKERGCRVVAAVSEEGSALGKVADRQVLLPVEKELCPFDLAPTISTTVQLLFGDLLAVALMKKKGISVETFAVNHPSGAIGEKLALFVRDVMKTGDDLPLCGPEERLIDVIVTLSDKRCGCLLVVTEERKLLGVFTDGDLRRALQTKGTEVMEMKVNELMSDDPITVQADELAYVALKKMQEKQYVMIAPVIGNDRVIGLIRMHDIVQKETDS
jgi:arabinose-5-phosphate isomerase